MSIRIKLAGLLISLGEFTKSLAVVMMKPHDLIEFGRRSYSKKESVSSFSDQNLLNTGLSKDEELMISKIPLRSGKLLVLGIGGGREAIPLAKMGFKVTGTDFVEEMCKSAYDTALSSGVKITVKKDEFSEPDFPPDSFDIVLLSTGMYSSIPSKKRRVRFLKKVCRILKPGGYFMFQFHWKDKKKFSPVKEVLKKVSGMIFFGNFSYETGDSLWRNKEFIHFFPDEKILRSELKESGMDMVFLEIPERDRDIRGNAILHKRETGE